MNFFKKLFCLNIRNLQSLAIEMDKFVNGGSPEIMKEVFRFREGNGYNLKHQNTFKCLIINSVYNGTEIVLFFGPKIRELIPTGTRELVSLNGF